MSLGEREIAVVGSGRLWSRRGQIAKPSAGPESARQTTNRLQSEVFQALPSDRRERSEAVMVTPEQTITGVSGSEPMLLAFCGGQPNVSRTR